MIPSRSYHQVASGFPMISLMLSSSRSGSIGRRNGSINSKLMKMSSYGKTGLSGRFLPGILVLRAGLLGPIELEDRADADLPDAPFEVGILDRDFATAQFAFDLDMGAFGQRGGELGELAEDHTAMPFGLCDILAALLVLVRGLGCERKCREAAVIGVTNFCVTAEESPWPRAATVDDEKAVERALQ